MLEVGITGHNFGRGPSKDHSTKVLLQLAQWFLRRFLCEFPIGSYVKLSSAVGGGPSWSKGRTARHIFGREPSNDYLIKILFLLSKWFQTRRFLWEFPIGYYVKLSSAVVAILVGGLKCWTQFWKGTTQTWGQLLSNVIDYITITLQFSWLHYITITSIFKCNPLHYNYFVNVIDYITDYIWCHDNQCKFKFAMLLLFVSNFCFFVCLLVCVQ